MIDMVKERIWLQRPLDSIYIESSNRMISSKKDESIDFGTVLWPMNAFLPGGIIYALRGVVCSLTCISSFWEIEFFVFEKEDSYEQTQYDWKYTDNARFGKDIFFMKEKITPIACMESYNNLFLCPLSEI